MRLNKIDTFPVEFKEAATLVLLYCKVFGKHRWGVGYYDDRPETWCWSYDDTPTHWMHLPGIPYDDKMNPDALCECGHPYYRHFDSYEDNYPIGCKYCPCNPFKAAKNETKSSTPTIVA